MTDPASASQAAATAHAADARNGLGLVMRVGVELVAAVLVGLAIGFGLDSWFGTRPLFLLLLAFLGGVAGLVNVWRLVSPDIRQTGRRAERPPG